MSGYRSRAAAKTARRPSDDLVEGMVKQFADPFAFLRELVQNAIDAGATQISVDVDLDAHGRPFISIEDDGAGMTMEIVEGPLLTLFSTSKEGQEGKIGKYGVGFMSVFAIEPLEVWIETHRAEGHLFVRLSRDHSYTIEERPARSGHGTKVALVLRDRDPAELRDAALAALRRYCRHVRCVVELVGEGSVVRVGEPLSIDAPVSVSVERDGFHVVVGFTEGTSLLERASIEGTSDYAGFFNRGLTLFESSAEEQVERGVRFKIDSAKLGHTLSRDTVRRDAAFARGMSIVREVAKGELVHALARELSESVADGSLERRAAALLRCALVHLAPKAIHVPLVVPLEGRRALTLVEVASLSPKQEPLLVASEADDVARALAIDGVPVVRSSASDALLGVLIDREVVSVAQHFDVLVPLEVPATEGRAFSRALRGVLGQAGLEFRSVILGTIRGEPLAHAFAVEEKRAQHPLTKRRQSARRRPKAGAALFLDLEDAFYRDAVARFADASPSLRRQVIALVARCVQIDLGVRAGERERDAVFRRAGA